LGSGKLFGLMMLFLACVEQSLASCVVDRFTVKQDFDPQRYAGKWYALQKKDPEGLFLQDNISAEYTVGDDGSMVASSRGRVTLFGLGWPATCPAVVSLRELTSPSALSGDNYWVIDTDYDNYAITYACRTLKEDGSCEDGYALVFSRNPRGLPPAIQRVVRQKQEEICMAGQFQPVLQSGAC
uniref:Retinol binding protein 4, like n=1 Tax=Poecilia latipinna TaxID=48699 RepID=A0A3B3UF35_9TELE